MIIKELLSMMFSSQSTIGERFLAVMMVLITITIIGITGIVLLAATDEILTTPTKIVSTMVEGKDIVSEDTTTTFSLIGDVIYPITTYEPTKYRVHFKINDEYLSFAVEKNYFDRINMGDEVYVIYKIKKLSGSYKAVDMRLKD